MQGKTYLKGRKGPVIRVATFTTITKTKNKIVPRSRSNLILNLENSGLKSGMMYLMERILADEVDVVANNKINKSIEDINIGPRRISWLGEIAMK